MLTLSGAKQLLGVTTFPNPSCRKTFNDEQWLNILFHLITTIPNGLKFKLLLWLCFHIGVKYHYLCV